MKHAWLVACAVALLYTATAHAQSTLMPPECKGKTGAQLDQCVRDLTQPTDLEGKLDAEKIELTQLLNCNLAYLADQGFCIARNEIVIECSKHAKHPNFDACVNRLITRPTLPAVAECERAAPPAQRSGCALRNKVFSECLKDPWRYFICLGEKMNAR